MMIEITIKKFDINEKFEERLLKIQEIFKVPTGTKPHLEIQELGEYVHYRFFPI